MGDNFKPRANFYINHKRTVSCKRLAFIPFVQQCVSPEGSSDKRMHNFENKYSDKSFFT